MIRNQIAMCVFAILGTIALYTNVAAQKTSNDPVITAIDAAILSLKQQPNQFTLNVTTAGAIVTNTGSGTGLNIEVTGGGVGSQQIGMVATANGQQISIAQSIADTALKQQAEKAIQILTEIKTAIKQPTKTKTNANLITNKLAEFSKTYVAPVLKTVIEALVKKRLGL